MARVRVVRTLEEMRQLGLPTEPELVISTRPPRRPVKKLPPEPEDPEQGNQQGDAE